MKFLSLYDFLGKPAGMKLGGEVYKKAKSLGIETKEREVSNSTYTGKITIYPEGFLKEYFENLEKDDKLPF